MLTLEQIENQIKAYEKHLLESKRTLEQITGALHVLSEQRKMLLTDKKMKELEAQKEQDNKDLDELDQAQ